MPKIFLIAEALEKASKLANIQFSEVDNLPNMQFIIQFTTSEFKTCSVCRICNLMNLPFLAPSHCFGGFNGNSMTAL